MALGSGLASGQISAYNLLLAAPKLQSYAKAMIDVLTINQSIVNELSAAAMSHLYWGNCLGILKKIPDLSVHLLVTDPPYANDYVSRSTTLPLVRIAGNGRDEAPPLVREALKLCYQKLQWNTHAYVFCDRWSYEMMKQAAIEAGFTPKNVLIWYKNNRTRGDLKGNYGYEDEWILFLHKGRRHLFGKRDGNVLPFKKVPSQYMQHPTEKPVELLKYLIQKSSVPGEVVLDPFAGIGSTGVAALEADRKCILMEIQEEWAQVAAVRTGLPMLAV